MSAKTLLLSVGLLGLAELAAAAGRAVPGNLQALYDHAKVLSLINPIYRHCGVYS